MRKKILFFLCVTISNPGTFAPSFKFEDSKVLNTHRGPDIRGPNICRDIDN